MRVACAAGLLMVDAMPSDASPAQRPGPGTVVVVAGAVAVAAPLAAVALLGALAAAVVAALRCGPVVVVSVVVSLQSLVQRMMSPR